MHLELLLRRTLAPDVLAEVERMHGATVRASRLANQLLALAKAESATDSGRSLSASICAELPARVRANGRSERTP